MADTRPLHPLAGSALVALQFGLMATIAWWAAPAFLAGRASLLAWGVGLASVALAAWALSANRPGNFNIRPHPKPGAQLVTAGPYAYIRHPMYSAVLLAGLAGLYGAGVPARMAVGTAFLALGVVLWVKAGAEERALAAQHPGYAAYLTTTTRFIPWLM